MKIKMSVFVLIICSVISISAMRSSEAANYNFQIDNFQILGNLPGSAMDDFNNNTLAPDWEIQDGTPFESGNFVYLQSPGELMEPVVVNGYRIIEERSAISSTHPSRFTVWDGEGDFSASAKWNAVIPDENQFYGIELWSPGEEDISFIIFNVGSNLADALGIGTTPGLKILLSHDSALQVYDISAADVVGSIILGLSFDDTNNLISPFFSLDNGSTIQAPFISVNTNFGDFNETVWMLEAASLDVQVAPVPEPTYTCIGFEPPCDSAEVALTVNKNKCIPLKTELMDENGISITDADIQYPPVLALVNFAGSAIPSEVVTVDGLPPSQATDGNQFEFIGGRWCFNLKVKDYYTAPGTYTFEMTTGDSEEYIIEPTCTVEIVVEK